MPINIQKMRVYKLKNACKLDDYIFSNVLSVIEKDNRETWLELLISHYFFRARKLTKILLSRRAPK